MKNEPYVDIINYNVFTDIRASITFVDKTEFINKVINLNTEAVYMIYGHKRWGKTVNLHSLFTFFALSRIILPDKSIP